MKTRVRKWGNSLAVRIPKVYAEQARLDVDVDVEMTMIAGGFAVRAVAPRAPKLKDLLRGVTDENRPVDWIDGPPVGKEAL